MNVVMIGSFAYKPKCTVSARAMPIAQALAKRSHRVTILIPPYDNLEDSGRIWEQGGVRLENATIRKNDWWSQITVPVRLARRAVQLRPDIVHVFKPIGYSGLAGQILCTFSRCPLVLDTDDWEGRGGWADQNPYPALWRKLFVWQEQWLARHAGAVTVASRTLQTQVWGFGVAPSRVVYLPNGPDPSMRTEVEEEQVRDIRLRLGVGNAPMLLYLGHIPHGTDLDLAIDALALIHDRLPEARLVIAGTGDGRQHLIDHAREAGLSDCVVLPGWIEHSQVPLFLAAADAVVNPYRDSLTTRAKCAIKVIEAMVMAKAVITTRIGQNLEYIEDGRSGLLTEPGDVAGLAQALLRVLSDRAWAASMGREAQRRIWKLFDWDARAGEVERAYRISLARRSSAGNPAAPA